MNRACACALGFPIMCCFRGTPTTGKLLGDEEDCLGEKTFTCLSDALALFRAKGDIAFPQASTAGRDLWSAACGLFEALLSGMTRHLPDVPVEATVRWRVVDPPSGAQSAQEVVSVQINIPCAPLRGEIATRSHIPAEIHLAEEVLIALQDAPQSLDRERSGLLCQLQGFGLIPIPEVEEVRRRIERDHGREFDMPTAYSWWLENRDSVCPLETSKFRWVIESLLGLRSVQMGMPIHDRQRTFWAFLFSLPVHWEGFEFSYDAKATIRVSALRKEPVDAEAVRLQEKMDIFLRKVVSDPRDQVAGELLTSSSFNLLRLHYGPSVNAPGASVEKATKLLSAAERWGIGEDGWQRFDASWGVSDTVDMFNRVTASQGRLIWHLPDFKYADSHTTTRRKLSPR